MNNRQLYLAKSATELIESLISLDGEIPAYSAYLVGRVRHDIQTAHEHWANVQATLARLQAEKSQSESISLTDDSLRPRMAHLDHAIAINGEAERRLRAVIARYTRALMIYAHTRCRLLSRALLQAQRMPADLPPHEQKYVLEVKRALTTLSEDISTNHGGPEGEFALNLRRDFCQPASMVTVSARNPIPPIYDGTNDKTYHILPRSDYKVPADVVADALIDGDLIFKGT